MTRRKSPLVGYEDLSPNCTVPRNNTIRRLTPHCLAGNLTARAALGLGMFKTYSPTNGASCTYAIGSDGDVGLGVEETNRPWTTSSAINDHQAITFEIANDGGAPDWHMSDKAIRAWVDLAEEICRAYGFRKVVYKEKPDGVKGAVAVEAWIATWAEPDAMAITLHNWYKNKACPGPYFMRKLPKLVEELNTRLRVTDEKPQTPVNENALLRIGDKGARVVAIQERLNIHGATPSLIVDGEFGQVTLDAVRLFQKSKGLSVDGIVGPVTLSALNLKPTEKSYLVRVAVKALNVRSGPGTNHPVVKVLVNDRNAYTIVEEASGVGSSKWGKLLSGVGWISLDHVTKV